MVLAAILSISGSITYSYHVIKGNAKPNRVTWILWGLIPIVAFFAQLDEGVGHEAIMTFMAGFGPIIVLISTFFNKNSYWQVSKLDIICGILSVIAVILWLSTGDGNVAIALSILADLLAAIPTIHKSFVHPESEHHSAFRNSALSAGITLATIDDWNFANYGFALYILIVCIIIYSLIKFSIGKRMLNRSGLRSSS